MAAKLLTGLLNIIDEANDDDPADDGDGMLLPFVG